MARGAVGGRSCRRATPPPGRAAMGESRAGGGRRGLRRGLLLPVASHARRRAVGPWVGRIQCGRTAGRTRRSGKHEQSELCGWACRVSDQRYTEDGARHPGNNPPRPNAPSRFYTVIYESRESVYNGMNTACVSTADHQRTTALLPDLHTSAEPTEHHPRVNWFAFTSTTESQRSFYCGGLRSGLPARPRRIVHGLPFCRAVAAVARDLVLAPILQRGAVDALCIDRACTDGLCIDAASE